MIDFLNPTIDSLHWNKNHEKKWIVHLSKWDPLVSCIEFIFTFQIFNSYTHYCFVSPTFKTEHSKSKKDSFEPYSSNDSILLSWNDDNISSSDEHVQFIAHQIYSLKKKMAKLKKDGKGFFHYQED